MTTGARIEVEGDREVRRALKRLGDAAKAGLRATHAESAQIVADAARGIVPRRSGVLAASIRSSGQIGAGMVRAGRAAVPYAGVIHFGWAAHSIALNPSSTTPQTLALTRCWRSSTRTSISRPGPLVLTFPQEESPHEDDL